jgi:hypothetical protein
VRLAVILDRFAARLDTTPHDPALQSHRIPVSLRTSQFIV